VLSCKRKRPSHRFLPHRRQSYRDHSQCSPNGLQVLLNRPCCSSRPKRSERRRQYSHHPSGTSCRRCGIYHPTPARRISYRAAPLGSWVHKQSGCSGIAQSRNGEVHPKSTVIQSGGGVHARGDRRDRWKTGWLRDSGGSDSRCSSPGMGRGEMVLIVGVKIVRFASGCLDMLGGPHGMPISLGCSSWGFGMVSKMRFDGVGALTLSLRWLCSPSPSR